MARTQAADRPLVAPRNLKPRLLLLALVVNVFSPAADPRKSRHLHSISSRSPSPPQARPRRVSTFSRDVRNQRAESLQIARKAGRVGALAAAFLVLNATPIQAAPTGSLNSLRHQITALKRDRARLFRERNTARRARDRYAADLKTAQTLTGTLQGVIAQLQADNTNLRNGLPDAIRAVPQADFLRLVFEPARRAYRCSSYYQSGDYWSYTFTRPSEFC